MTALAVVPGHLLSSFCSISSFHHLMLLALLAFEFTTRFSFLGHPLTSFFFMVFSLCFTVRDAAALPEWDA